MTTITNLKCEYCINPTGIDKSRPYLSWEITGGRFPVYQEEYRVIVEAGGRIFWDSDFVKSQDTINIEYSGADLVSLNKYNWKVIVKTSGGETIESSEAFFITGLLDKTLLNAKWIEHPGLHDNPVFYGDFYVKNELESAYILISGLGYYELKLNGVRGHDTYNVPGWTDYSKRDLSGLLYPYDGNSRNRVLYNIYDIEKYLNKGINRFEVMLGNGFFNQVERFIEGDMSYGTPRMLMEIHLKYKDGQETVICSDEETYCTDGPLEFNNIYFGEKRNDNIGMDFTGALKAMECVWDPGGLESQFDSYDRIAEVIRPMHAGDGLYDAGRNLSGRTRIAAHAPRGAVFSITYFDAIDQEGNPDFRSTGGEWQIQENRYVFGESGRVDYAETFGWRGFRYFRIDKDEDVVISDITVEVIHADYRMPDSIRTDCGIVEWINTAFINSQTSNMHGGVPSDCPHRERLGYTGDGQVAAEAALASMDCINFYRKWNRDIIMSQNSETGFVPHTVPFSGGGGGPGWGSACAVIPKELYNRTFDKRIVHDSYGTLQNWIVYLESKNPGLIIEREEEGSWCLGDWCIPIGGYDVAEVDLKKIFSEMDPALVNTAFFYSCVKTCIEFGKILSRETTHYERLAERIKNKFNERYLSKENLMYSKGKHFSNVYPLYFGMVPEEHKAGVLNTLALQIEACEYSMDAGIFAASMIFRVLAEGGRTDLIERMLLRREYPSYGFMKEAGATTLWETWDGKASLNHPMFGGTVSFFYKYLAGIRYINADRMILLEPVFINTINRLRLTQDTIFGDIEVSWERAGHDGSENEKIIMNIKLPGNTRAALKIGGSIKVLENGFNELLISGNTIELKKEEHK